MNSMITIGKFPFTLMSYHNLFYTVETFNVRIFFEACDGIFINYTWNMDNLALSALNAGDRIIDVYTGIDVFGRNCFGGGGFNTSSALSAARQYGLSAAIFAPGWVYETHPVEQFQELNTKFWLSLLSCLKIHYIVEFPLETSFCPGYGLSRFHNGEVIYVVKPKGRILDKNLLLIFFHLQHNTCFEY